jgi:hypothetical protein
MDSNTHSTSRPDQLAALAAAVDGLAAHDLDRLGDAALAERVMALRGLVDRLEGHWLGELAAVDARGAAGAEQGVQAGSTAAWLRNRLRMGPGTAAGWVRTARALFRGPLAGTAKALTNGELSAAHASVLAHGTHDLPDQVTAEAEPGAGGGGPAARPTPAAAGPGPPAAGRRPRHHRPPGPAAP